MKYAFVALLAIVTLYLTLNLHSRTGYLTYKSELYADKAGYYCYLPAAFIYGFDGHKVPANLPASVGNGFYVNAEAKIGIKYPIGVAVLQAPFFLVTHFLLAPSLGYPADGFSAPYHKMVDVAAWAYLLLGLLLLVRVLGEYFDRRTVWATILLFLVGTNLWYYFAVESGMSHVYSFFLVSALLRLSQRLHRRGRLDLGMGFALGAVAGLLVITRFTNALLLVIPLLWEVRSAAELKTRFRVLLTGRGWLVLPLVPLVLISLQMGYYFYLSGSPFHYAYASEGFDFGHPALLETWFSPHNGLFLYAPMMVFALVGLGRMAERKIAGAWLGIGLFVVTSYVFASWWQWYFGCALGARSFVEYYPIYMVAFGYFLQWLGTKAAPWRVGTWTVMVLLAILSFKNGYLYKLCYLGEGDWDWNWFLGLVGAV